ncbi:MAG: UvrD-like helicase C-terminal domain protein, partial [Petrotoga mobilis]
ILFPEPMEECKDLRASAIRVIDENENISAKDLVDKLREEIIHPEIPLQRNEVSIMSLHKAKGLEADLVIIPACVQGLIPSIDRDKTSDEQRRELEENRRLFYVGITRTKKVLILSSFLWMNIGQAKKMKIHYTVSKNLAKVQSSQFLGELGSRCPKAIKGEIFLKERCEENQI